jgi:quinate dehydrogenase
LVLEEKGVLLEMCFKPRNTRTRNLGRRVEWKCLEGTGLIGFQIETQWGLWAREVVRKTIPK